MERSERSESRASKNYKEGKIYAIRSKQTEDFYISSTCCSLTKRFSQHKGRFTKEGNALPCPSKEILKYDDAFIELMELCPCENIDELNRRAGQLIREHRNKCVNAKVAKEQKQYVNAVVISAREHCLLERLQREANRLRIRIGEDKEQLDIVECHMRELHQELHEQQVDSELTNPTLPQGKQEAVNEMFEGGRKSPPQRSVPLPKQKTTIDDKIAYGPISIHN